MLELVKVGFKTELYRNPFFFEIVNAFVHFRSDIGRREIVWSLDKVLGVLQTKRFCINLF